VDKSNPSGQKQPKLTIHNTIKKRGHTCLMQQHINVLRLILFQPIKIYLKSLPLIGWG